MRNKHSALDIMDRFNDSTIEMDGWKWCRQITGYLSIYPCLTPRKYYGWYLWYLLATTPPFLKKYSKFERICGNNCSFIIKKGPFVEWIAATGGKLTLYLWNSDDYKCLFQRKTVPLKILRSLKVASWNNGGTTQIYGCMCSFEITIRFK